MQNLRVYKVNQHQHTPEIEQQLLQWNNSIQPVTFTTHLLPITRGIMTTAYVQLKNEMRTTQLLELYSEIYHQHPFIRIRPENTFPSIKEVAGSNYCDIGLHADNRTGRLTIVSVIDNFATQDFLKISKINFGDRELSNSSAYRLSNFRSTPYG